MTTGKVCLQLVAGKAMGLPGGRGSPIEEPILVLSAVSRVELSGLLAWRQARQPNPVRRSAGPVLRPAT